MERRKSENVLKKFFVFSLPLLLVSFVSILLVIGFYPNIKHDNGGIEIVKKRKTEEGRVEIALEKKDSTKYLFDINFETDDKTVDSIEDLSVRVIFTSFGTEPTPVNLLFSILDSSGKEIHMEQDYLVVETERVFTKNFNNLKFPSGKYTLELQTLYNVDVLDEFRQDFEISKNKIVYVWLVLGILLVSIVGGYLYLSKETKNYANQITQ